MKKLIPSRRNQWVKELERDLLALGSVVFYFLVVGRALVGPFWDLFTPLVIIAIVFILISQADQELDFYLARGFVLAVLVTRHYSDIAFGMFAAVAFIAMIFASLHRDTSRRGVIKGVLLGFLCSVAALPFAAMLD